MLMKCLHTMFFQSIYFSFICTLVVHVYKTSEITQLFFFGGGGHLKPLSVIKYIVHSKISTTFSFKLKNMYNLMMINVWYIVKVNFVWGPSFIAPSLQNGPSNKQKTFYLHGGLGSGLAGISVNKMTEVNISVKTQTRPSTL